MAGQLRFQGIGVSEGIRIGRAFRLDEPSWKAASRKDGRGKAAFAGNAADPHEQAEVAEREGKSGFKPDPADELRRLADARKRSIEQLEELARRTKESLGEDKAAILVGQLRLLSDPAFYPRMENLVREEGRSAEDAIWEVTETFAAKLERLNDDYMRERAADIRDVGRRLIGALDDGEGRLAELSEEVILVADDLSPSETAQLDKRYILAFVTRSGGKTSHTAILARSLGIPAVVGVGGALDEVRPGDTLIVDGAAGLCIVRPDEATVRTYGARMDEERVRLAVERSYANIPARSSDGRRVEIGANIGTAREAEAAAESGADGVGLFRTEFLFMRAARLPDEEEQFRAYREAVRLMRGRPVVIRTFDIGGDKQLPYLEMPKEANPFLGYRAIRVALDQEQWLRTQLRAIARASAHGPVKVMFPMISGLDEWRRAKRIFDEEIAALHSAGVPLPDRIETGIMVEIPSAALLADSFAREVDFFSIGTNDLAQYTLAVDRMNGKVARLYDDFHPAVLRLIRLVIDAAHAHDKRVGMCGRMAGDPLAAPLLLGLGLDEWSMDIGSIPKVKSALARLNSARCRELADRLLEFDTPEAVRAELERIRRSHDVM